MRESNPSLPPSVELGQLKASAVCSSYLALLLAFSALPGCGGNTSDSQVNGSGASNSGQSGAPAYMIPNPNGGQANGSGGADPGVYVLPTDFKKAQMGGFKLGAAIDPGGMAGADGGPVTGCGTQILGVVRDFKGNSEPGGHPDFEHFGGGDASLGIVKSTLGADQKPEYSQPAASPFVDVAVNGDKANGQQTTDKMSFDEWYRATANVNKPYIVYFYFEPNGGVLTFQSTAFFPLDGAGWGDTRGEGHNFGFTTEVHTKFDYKGKETFSFTGDDDLWVFINHKLAIDLGGLHSEASKSIDLDEEATNLGITVGNVYDLDLFHAERHTSQSNFRVDTNLSFTNCGTIIEEPPVK